MDMKRVFHTDVSEGNCTTAKSHKTRPDLKIPVKPLNLYDRNFPFYRKPKEIGFFSTNSKQDFCDDNHMLRFYTPPTSLSVNFDLTEGYENFIKKDESVMCYINDILKWILLHKDRFCLVNEKDQPPQRLNTDFVCWRGLLTKLMCTPYTYRDDWEIAVTLYKGTFYLCEFETEKQTQERVERSAQHEEMCYWGWKFEQYLTSDTPDGEPDPSVAVNNKAAYVTVVRTRLAAHSLVFAGEVDAIDVTGKPHHYVELKTTRQTTTARQEENFKRFKLLKWWAQSFLPDVPTIVTGYRDDDGIVHSLMNYTTSAIPKLVKGSRDAWEPCVCVNFLNDILSFIKKSITQDDHRHVHILQWREGASHVTLTDKGTQSRYTFLPQWYTNLFVT